MAKGAYLCVVKIAFGVVVASTAMDKVGVGLIDYKLGLAFWLIMLMIAYFWLSSADFVPAFNFHELLRGIEAHVLVRHSPIVSFLGVISPFADVKAVAFHSAYVAALSSRTAHANKIIFHDKDNKLCTADYNNFIMSKPEEVERENLLMATCTALITKNARSPRCERTKNRRLL